MDTIERTTTELTITGDDLSGYYIHDAEGKLITGFSDRSDAERFIYDEKRRAMDPEPWIKPATGERFAEEQQGVFCVHSPRIVWPEHGGRMVRRDYLRPGDRAFSSHYGPRTVEAVQQSGTEGQTTTILWVRPAGVQTPFSERADSSNMIELLPEAI